MFKTLTSVPAKNQNNLKLGFGFEGLRDTQQWSDNTFVSYPYTRDQSRYRQQIEPLSDDLKAFMDKYQSMVLVTAFQDSDDISNDNEWSVIRDTIKS